MMISKRIRQEIFKKNPSQSLSGIKIQSVASLASGTAMMATVAQPYRRHLNGNVNDAFDMEECYARATVAGTRAQSLTVIVSPIDMQGMIGMIFNRGESRMQ